MNEKEVRQAALSFVQKMKDIRDWEFEKVEIPEGSYYSVYVGNLLDISPSEKYEPSWTTNQNQNDIIVDLHQVKDRLSRMSKDIEIDILFWEIVIQNLSDIGMWTEQGKGEGDPLDTYLCKWEVK